MDLKLPPPPNEIDVRKTIWSLWFEKLAKMMREISNQFVQIDGQFVAMNESIIFISQRPQFRSKTGLPTASEQAVGTWSLWRNNADNTFRIVVRDSLGLRAFELTPLNPI